MQKKVFIDCGAHCGCSVTKFLQQQENSEQFEIHSFEVNPEFDEYLRKLADSNPAVRYHNGAAWTADGKANFYISRTRREQDGSSLIKEKVTGALDKEHPIEVDTIDLSRFIEQNFSSTDYIILKLDIEGAEYDVLRHLHEKGTLLWIDELHIEWHWQKIQISKSEHDNVVSLVANIPTTEWCAQKHCKNKYR